MVYYGRRVRYDRISVVVGDSKLEKKFGRGGLSQKGRRYRG